MHQYRIFVTPSFCFILMVRALSGSVGKNSNPYPGVIENVIHSLHRLSLEISCSTAILFSACGSSPSISYDDSRTSIGSHENPADNPGETDRADVVRHRD